MLDIISKFTLQDWIFCALLALCVTWSVKSLARVSKIMKLARSVSVSSGELPSVVEKCYKLFPLEKIVFKGQTFTRGMKVKLTTNTDNDFEGEFIGVNTKNMVCIRTRRYIIAHNITNIRQMVPVKGESL
ncbi:MAG: hypothetical protein IJS61_09655 [Firmicutes bacterium]|nr:hypothetical protein [Bacillota bacterium]